VAFPAISTGVFGYPKEEAARIAVGTVQDSAPGLKNVRHVCFVLFGKADEALYATVLEELSG
jgi:O-acetyl-ADP-ribose deacetylase (regulator of RNase III)